MHPVPARPFEGERPKAHSSFHKKKEKERNDFSGGDIVYIACILCMRTNQGTRAGVYNPHIRVSFSRDPTAVLLR